MVLAPPAPDVEVVLQITRDDFERRRRDDPVAETHLSVLVGDGDRILKRLKPVDLGFVDHTDLERRVAAVEAEVRLNRRFAPTVYLGLADLVDDNEEVIDRMLVMRRLPDAARLAARLHRPDVGDEIAAVVRQVSRVHADPATEPSEELRHQAGGAALAHRWTDNAAVIRERGGSLIDREEMTEAESLAAEYVAGRTRLFERRLAEHRVRDGHGDLLCEDIFCTDDGPHLLDCLAFSDELRTMDDLDDVATLAMDLEFRGRPDLAAQALALHDELTGGAAPASLAHHYVAYRAHMRAKVALLHNDPVRHAEAARLHRLSLDHLRSGRVRMVLIGGVPGTGKSTLADLLAARTGWVVIRSDELRKDLVGLPHLAAAAADLDQGIYAKTVTRAVYAEALRRAELLLGLGESVILDASWTDAGYRADAAGVAGRSHAALHRLRTTAPPAVRNARIRSRYRDASDADPNIAAVMDERADPWTGWSRVDTDGPVGRELELVLRELELGSTSLVGHM